MVESGRAARPKILRVDARGTHQAGGKISFVSQRRLFHSIGAKRTSEPAIQLAGPSRIEANAEPGLGRVPNADLLTKMTIRKAVLRHE
jgi:hypothetical protein